MLVVEAGDAVQGGRNDATPPAILSAEAIHHPHSRAMETAFGVAVARAYGAVAFGPFLRYRLTDDTADGEIEADFSAQGKVFVRNPFRQGPKTASHPCVVQTMLQQPWRGQAVPWQGRQGLPQ